MQKLKNQEPFSILPIQKEDALINLYIADTSTTEWQAAVQDGERIKLRIGNYKITLTGTL